jgi:hypothetical protein
MADGTKFPSIDYRKCEPWLKQQQKQNLLGKRKNKILSSLKRTRVFKNYLTLPTSS